jgi:23S rRNA (uracil1939-C5)-methyltransferase
VIKQNGEVVFVAKTLPDETVTAQIVKKRKGVAFAVLKNVDEAAANRVEASCSHYDQCPGCHYLHTDYDSELLYKKQALRKLFHQLPVNEDQVEVLAAPKRNSYRNRIQLHYRGNKIGLVDGMTDQLVEIPECQIVRSELQTPLAALYQDRSWAKEKRQQDGQKRPNTGHLELYLKSDTEGQEIVSTEWNGRYAHGGFTQVYDEMNELLCQQVTGYLSSIDVISVLDLFSGDGNLSHDVCANEDVTRTMVDYSADNHSDDYYALDLFAEDALKQFQRAHKNKAYDVLLVDPPRKGFPDINAWVKKYKPKHLVYVSCNATTMVRDLMSIESKFRIEKVQLLDLFPSTYHFETICYLTLK